MGLSLIKRGAVVASSAIVVERHSRLTDGQVDSYTEMLSSTMPEAARKSTIKFLVKQFTGGSWQGQVGLVADIPEWDDVVTGVNAGTK